MTFTTRDYQARCWAYGIDAGPIDGLWGPKTQAGVRALMERKQVERTEAVFHRSGLHRVIMHWTAGAYGDIAMERDAYHALIDRDGRVIPGTKPPEANADVQRGVYAPHTLRLNTGSIGVAVDAMAGAQERPFSWGSAPITRAQIDGLARAVADFCATYDIPVSRYSTLTHAEVQPTLGVRQRWKWDITVLPGMTKPGDPVAVGDALRERVAAALEEVAA